MADFFEKYFSLLKIALETGVQSVHIPRNLSGQPVADERVSRKFISSCHRGFDNGQKRIVHLLHELDKDDSIPVQEKEYRQLLLRKVADAIAFTMLRTQSHVVRRLKLHDHAPGISLGTIDEALETASRLNSEGRQTFALVADLTTFVHVADLVRVDFRPYKPTVSLIELKSGRVNEILLEHLEKFDPKEESIKLIEENSEIEGKYKPQAKRMLRQRIRIAKIQEILATDEGTDITSNLPIKLSKEEFVAETYDSFLNKLCNEAKKEGYAAGSVNRCIHIGVGYSSDKDESRNRAIRALNYAIFRHLSEPPEGFVDTFNEIKSVVPEKELYKAYDVLYSNLNTVSCKPLVLWRINRRHLLSLLRKELCILASFDVSSFIWLGRQVGFDIGLSSRKRAAQEAQRFGSLNVPTWGGRGILYNTPEEETFILSGLLGRFAVDLLSPLPFLEDMYKVQVAKA